MAKKEYKFRNPHGKEVWVDEKLATRIKNAPGFEYLGDETGQKTPIPDRQKYDKEFIIDTSGRTVPKEEMRKHFEKRRKYF